MITKIFSFKSSEFNLILMIGLLYMIIDDYYIIEFRQLCTKFKKTIRILSPEIQLMKFKYNISDFDVDLIHFYFLLHD